MKLPFSRSLFEKYRLCVIAPNARGASKEPSWSDYLSTCLNSCRQPVMTRLLDDFKIHPGGISRIFKLQIQTINRWKRTPWQGIPSRILTNQRAAGSDVESALWPKNPYGVFRPFQRTKIGIEHNWFPNEYQAFWGLRDLIGLRNCGLPKFIDDFIVDSTGCTLKSFQSPRTFGDHLGQQRYGRSTFKNAGKHLPFQGQMFDPWCKIAGPEHSVLKDTFIPTMPTGGCLSYLWGEGYGPIQVGSQYHYQRIEPVNMPESFDRPGQGGHQGF